MNIDNLHRILRHTTAPFRKGPEIREEQLGNLVIIEIDDMPHEETIVDLEAVDLYFVTVGVDKARAERYRNEFIEILNDWPDSSLEYGPSYITVGAVIGDQGAAFQMFALGKVLGLWNIILPSTFGMTGAKADKFAGMGYIMISGYQRND